MPSVAPNSRVKRILSSTATTRPSSSASSPRKKSRVRFDNYVKVAWPEKEAESDSMLIESVVEDDAEVDFTLSIGDDGDIDYTITAVCSNDEKHVLSIDRPMSPIEGCEHCLSDGLCSCSSDLDDESVQCSVATKQSLHFEKSIYECNRATSPAPLITPPASPKRINTISKYGEEEEATICEWPCNLAVDIAITAAASSDMLMPLLDYQD